MEHANPILLGNNSPQKFITIGEVMLRLTPPNYEKIRMASSFEASYGGSEADIALALANLGVDTTFFSRGAQQLPGQERHPLAALQRRALHADDPLHHRRRPPAAGLGTYYLETGYGIRAQQGHLRPQAQRPGRVRPDSEVDLQRAAGGL